MRVTTRHTILQSLPEGCPSCFEASKPRTNKSAPSEWRNLPAALRVLRWAMAWAHTRRRRRGCFKTRVGGADWYSSVGAPLRVFALSYSFFTVHAIHTAAYTSGLSRRSPSSTLVAEAAPHEARDAHRRGVRVTQLRQPAQPTYVSDTSMRRSTSVHSLPRCDRSSRASALQARRAPRDASCCTAAMPPAAASPARRAPRSAARPAPLRTASHRRRAAAAGAARLCPPAHRRLRLLRRCHHPIRAADACFFWGGAGRGGGGRNFLVCAL